MWTVTEQEILNRVTAVVRDQLDDDEVSLTMDTVAKAVDGWDSLAHVRIMVAIEESFGIEFRTSDISGLDNVGDLVRLIEASR